MKAKDLATALMLDPDMEVFFTCDYGDDSSTGVVMPVEAVDKQFIMWSDKADLDKVVTTEEVEEQCGCAPVRLVVILK